MTKEVMKQALEALYGFIPYLPLKDEKQCNKYDKAIKALEEALKQEQDEPVAWVIHSNGEEHGLDFWQDEINALPIGTFLYTTPQTKEWVGLTDEQYEELSQLTHVEVIKLIEDILKNNNT